MLSVSVYHSDNPVVRVHWWPNPWVLIIVEKHFITHRRMAPSGDQFAVFHTGELPKCKNYSIKINMFWNETFQLWNVYSRLFSPMWKTGALLPNKPHPFKQKKELEQQIASANPVLNYLHRLAMWLYCPCFNSTHLVTANIKCYSSVKLFSQHTSARLGQILWPDSIAFVP